MERGVWTRLNRAAGWKGTMACEEEASLSDLR